MGMLMMDRRKLQKLSIFAKNNTLYLILIWNTGEGEKVIIGNAEFLRGKAWQFSYCDS